MKQFIIVSCLSLFLFSCSEKSIELAGALPPAAGGTGGGTTTTPAAAGTLTCNMDGVASAFNTNTTAAPSGVTGANILHITGFKDGTGATQMSVILGNSTATFDTGTYTDTSTTEIFGGLGYRDATGTYISNNDRDNPCIITVTAKSATSIQGTFKGAVYRGNADGTFSNKKLITNGQFNVKY